MAGKTRRRKLPIAIATPALPDGFERIVDRHGNKLMRPAPARAVADLLQILATVPLWERFPANRGEWTPSQIRERARPMPGYMVTHGLDPKERRFPVVKSRFSFSMMFAAPACSFEHEVPVEDREHLVAEWERRTGRKRTQNEPVIVRSPIDERRELVRGLRTGFDVFVPQAIAAVLGAGGHAAPLRELERDPELCADTVAAAVAELRKVAVPAAQKDKTEEEPWLPIDEAAQRECVSRWRARKWATKLKVRMPVRGEDGQPLQIGTPGDERKPANPLQTRCSYVREWDGRSRERARLRQKSGNSRQSTATVRRTVPNRGDGG